MCVCLYIGRSSSKKNSSYEFLEGKIKNSWIYIMI